MNKKNKPTILIVDDEDDVLTTLKAFLTREGFDVMTASDGPSAIDRFSSRSVDLVITDVRMPNMDGLDLTRRIKAMDGEVEVIVLTAYASMENAISAMRDYGAFEYQPKPILDSNAFVNTIEKALTLRTLKRENKNLLRNLRSKKTELENANTNLLKEIENRKKAEKDRERLIDELKKALEEIKTLRGIVPICSECKKIRDDREKWVPMETYIEKHSEASFSHGLCPTCFKKNFGDEEWYADVLKEMGWEKQCGEDGEQNG